MHSVYGASRSEWARFLRFSGGSRFDSEFLIRIDEGMVLELQRIWGLGCRDRGNCMTSRTTGWGELRKQSKTLRRKFQELISQAATVAMATPGEAINASQALSSELAAWETDTLKAGVTIRGLLRQIEPQARIQTEHLEERLAREISRRGHSVHGDASPLLVDGIAHVEIDTKELRVTVNGVVVPQLDPVHIGDVVAAEITRLRKGATTPSKMLVQLRLAYDQEIRAAGGTPGAQVTTENILLQLVLLRQPAAFRSDPQSRNFRDYPREQFRADLFTLLHSGEHETGGRRLRYAAGPTNRGHCS